jgi:hypothetical protein
MRTAADLHGMRSFRSTAGAVSIPAKNTKVAIADVLIKSHLLGTGSGMTGIGLPDEIMSNDRLERTDDSKKGMRTAPTEKRFAA